MTCCPPAAHEEADLEIGGIEADDRALQALSRPLSDGTCQLEFAVPDAHCASCIRAIETELAALPMVETARVNLSRRRVRIKYDPNKGVPSALAPTIRRSGYVTHVIDPADDSHADPVLRELVRAMAVAGFAAGNIMLFSVSVWAGADDATRDLFHWFSALIALPAVAYAGRPFFRSAWRALSVGRTNMDVPIAIGVLLATGLSLFETITSGAHAYFDASTMLLFFLLAGRTLDHLMRERARTAVANLARLAPPGATRILPDGSRDYLALDEIAPKMLLELKAGERVPVDALVVSGAGAVDASIVTGESAPVAAQPGVELVAGALNLDGLLVVEALRASNESFLARMGAMMEAAENARTRYRRIADRASALYAPVVHLTALATFIAWGLIGGDWHQALVNAVAVLIITCPCALALAVPIVHVVAAGRLFERGILMKDGGALERAASVTSVAFDKTGTLTNGKPRLVENRALADGALELAAGLASLSTHPLSRAIAAGLPPAARFDGAVREFPGQGIEGEHAGHVYRLGRPDWAGASETLDAQSTQNFGTQSWLTEDGRPIAWFRFVDMPRADAGQTVAALKALDLPVRLLSGDRPDVAIALGSEVGIANALGGLLPEQKLADIAANEGTLMVGDGVNDAPAMRAATVSIAPSSAADIGRSAADFVFTGQALGAVPFVIRIARRASRLVAENLILAIGYNIVAVPLAVFGLVTPLIAAVAMSSSSLLVVANAMRLRLGDKEPASAQASVSSRFEEAKA
jgi:P-type Cu2+ transporter